MPNQNVAIINHKKKIYLPLKMKFRGFKCLDFFHIKTYYTAFDVYIFNLFAYLIEYPFLLKKLP